MREIVSDFGLAILLAVIGMGIVALFVGFIGQISVSAMMSEMAEHAYLTCAAIGGMVWTL